MPLSSVLMRHIYSTWFIISGKAIEGNREEDPPDTL